MERAAHPLGGQDRLARQLLNHLGANQREECVGRLDGVDHLFSPAIVRPHRRDHKVRVVRQQPAKLGLVRRLLQVVKMQWKLTERQGQRQ